VWMERVPFVKQSFSNFTWGRRCGASVGGNGAASDQEWGGAPSQTLNCQIPVN
jgi:hypothetical protein